MISAAVAELRRLSYIANRARAAERDPAFSSRIREGLPEIRNAWITLWLFRHSLARSLKAQDFSDRKRNVAQAAGADHNMRILAEKQHY
jgi:hypothetical protein